MLGPALYLTAAILSATRFGPNDMVQVERVGEQTSIVAYGDTQIVKILAEDFEIADCQEVLRDGLNPGRCLFSAGGQITVSRDPNGTRLRVGGVAPNNYIEFVVNLAGREEAAKALEP
jgi:hypothetical protein